ncbi:MAG: hypothetical protein AAFQ80_02170 [Cyanobacteria bacterium J06621_8]
MTGSTPFSIEESEFFKRWLRKLVKASGKILAKKLITLLTASLDDLLDNPYPRNSRREPLPGKIKLPDDWTFYKLEFRLAKGASGQIRLMYLVNEPEKLIKPLWIYSHEQFAKRPRDRNIADAIEEIIGL